MTAPQTSRPGGPAPAAGSAPLPYCRCGHPHGDHLADGPDEPATSCEWVWGDRSCTCRYYSNPMEEP